MYNVKNNSKKQGTLKIVKNNTSKHIYKNTSINSYKYTYTIRQSCKTVMTCIPKIQTRKTFLKNYHNTKEN